MTAEDKAKELLKRFWPFVEHSTDGFHDKALEQENSKQCAIICVDEIISLFVNECEDSRFYQQVKQHLQSL